MRSPCSGFADGVFRRLPSTAHSNPVLPSLSNGENVRQPRRLGHGVTVVVTRYPTEAAGTHLRNYTPSTSSAHGVADFFTWRTRMPFSPQTATFRPSGDSATPKGSASSLNDSSSTFPLVAQTRTSPSLPQAARR